MISNVLKILGLQPRISKLFSIPSTIFSHSSSEQVWQQNTICQIEAIESLLPTSFASEFYAFFKSLFIVRSFSSSFLDIHKFIMKKIDVILVWLLLAQKNTWQFISREGKYLTIDWNQFRRIFAFSRKFNDKFMLQSILCTSWKA